MTNEPHLDDAIRFYRALSNTQRLRIVGALASAWSTPPELAETLHLPAADVRQHLGQLRELGSLKGNDSSDSWTIDVEQLRVFGKALDDVVRSVSSVAGIDAAELDAIRPYLQACALDCDPSRSSET